MKRLNLLDLFSEGYKEGKKNPMEHAAMSNPSPYNPIAEATEGAVCWLNMYEVGETIYEPAEHTLYERLDMVGTWVRGYLAGSES